MNSEEQPGHSSFVLHPSSFSTNELLRKTLHIGFGILAVFLKFLPWRVAAAIAAAAVVMNWLLLHRVVGKRVARHERGWDWGIVLYPAAVMLTIVVTGNHYVFDAAAGALVMAVGFAATAPFRVGMREPAYADSR